MNPIEVSNTNDLAKAIQEGICCLTAQANSSAIALASLNSALNFVQTLDAGAGEPGAPIKIAIEVDGGLVEQIRCLSPDNRPVVAYVHDHDVGGVDEERIVELEVEGEAAECTITVHNNPPAGDDTFWASIAAAAAVD